MCYHRFIKCSNKKGALFVALYSMKQLEELLDTTPQTIHRLLRQNTELKELSVEHITRKEGRKVFYDDTILEWLKGYFGIENADSSTQAAGGPDNSTNSGGTTERQEEAHTGGTEEKHTGGAEEKPERGPQEEQSIEQLQRRIKDLEAQIQNKDKIIEELELQLKNKEAERIHFITENGQLLGLLAAEKAEKQRFLPPPKVPIGERIKRLFSGKKEE